MLAESQIIAKMKVPEVFLLAVLGCSLTEGRLVPECELWGELKNATANLTLNGNNLVAKLVCQAEQVSGLNTTVVKQPIEKEISHSGEQTEDRHGREDNHSGHNDSRLNSRPSRHRVRRNDKGRSLQTRPLAPASSPQNCTSADCHAEPAPSLNNSTENHQDSHEEEDDHNGRGKGRPRRRIHDKRPSSPTQPPAQRCMLYGIFQLSNCHACNDSVTQTANVCGIPCSNLLDDDISDDISCLINLLNRGNHEIGTISDDKCEHEKDSVYIVKC